MVRPFSSDMGTLTLTGFLIVGIGAMSEGITLMQTAGDLYVGAAATVAGAVALGVGTYLYENGLIPMIKKKLQQI